MRTIHLSQSNNLKCSKAQPAIKYTVSTHPSAADLGSDPSVAIIIESFTPQHERHLVDRDGDAAAIYSRICGPWVPVLPKLLADPATNRTVLLPALQALSTAITGRETKNETIISESRKIYNHALQCLCKVLDGEDTSSKPETLAARMSLNLVEVWNHLTHRVPN